MVTIHPMICWKAWTIVILTYRWIHHRFYMYEFFSPIQSVNWSSNCSVIKSLSCMLTYKINTDDTLLAPKSRRISFKLFSGCVCAEVFKNTQIWHQPYFVGSLQYIEVLCTHVYFIVSVPMFHLIRWRIKNKKLHSNFVKL